MHVRTTQRLRVALCAATVATMSFAGMSVASASGGSGGGGSTSGGGGSSTGGGGSSTGGGGGGGGGVKPGCVNVISVTGTASESLAGNSFSATPTLISCQSKTKIGLSVVDVSTGATVFAMTDVNTPTVFWNLPYTLTSYRVTARAYATISGVLTTVATGSIVLDTLDPLPCTTEVVETPTVGYWISYAAIWAHHSANDCGMGGYVEIKITNSDTGVVETDVNTGMLVTYDYEGPAVSYSTRYHVEAILHSRSGAVLASSGVDVVTPPMP